MDGRNETASIPDLVWYFLPTIVLVPPLWIPANALVLRLLLGKPNICSTSEIFVLNLAVFDMMFCFMVVIEYIYFMFNKTNSNSDFLSWGLSQAGGSDAALRSFFGRIHGRLSPVDLPPSQRSLS
ncbi:hypothetical protein OYC64_016242 [Pagothenia borchgrevinki]|uniref:G-protein coupled receptors family 1 profile domain-containing protein n=1 Tax=Pagothenia borchgrevinki TaxID=8213 RepID=A0ABD2HKF5_PAGBO